MKERKAYEIFAEDEEYEYIQLRSGLTARRRRTAGEGASRAREINDRLEKQGRYFDDSTKIIRADRDSR